MPPVSSRNGSERARVGIVGGGWVATARHIPAFGRDGVATVAALLDRDRGRGESVATRFRIPRYFDSLEEFLRDDLDVVSVCTPPEAHAEVVEAALRAGKHVLVEKPMTMSSGEGRALEALARERGVVLCPSHNFLFSRSARRAEALLQKGDAGEVKWAMGLQLSSPRRRLPSWYEGLPGGLFFDEAPHLLYLMRHFLGAVQVEHAWRAEGGQDRHTPGLVQARLQGTRGMGQIMMWFDAPMSEWLFILFCSRAVIVLDLFRDVMVRMSPERAHNATDILRASASGTAQLWGGIAGSGVRQTAGRLLYGHEVLIREFLKAVEANGEPPVSAREGWEVVSLMEEILERSAQGG